MSTHITLFIGIDAGGTKTRLLAKRSDQTLAAEVFLPGLNLQRDGLEAALQMLTTGIEKAIGDTQSLLQTPTQFPDVLSLCAGIAGAGLDADCQILSDLLKEKIRDTGFKQCKVQLLTDAAVAFHAAHADHPGLLIIAGTGSILWAKAYDGQLYRSGGWGYLLGDEGGGYRIGLAGLKATANMMDGGPETALLDAFCNQFQICTADALRQFVYNQKVPLQQAAPVVLDIAAGGDPVALQILTHQTLAVAAQLKWLIQSAPAFPLDAVLIGGLCNHAFYRDFLTNTLCKQFQKLSFRDPACEPVEAALDMATQI